MGNAHSRYGGRSGQNWWRIEGKEFVGRVDWISKDIGVELHGEVSRIMEKDDNHIRN